MLYRATVAEHVDCGNDVTLRYVQSSALYRCWSGVCSEFLVCNVVH